MARVRDILLRFRPATAPGAAGAAGVPVDVVADRRAELAPVFSLLGDVERECAEILAAADRDATEIAERYTRLAAEVRASAATEAEVARSDAAASVQKAADVAAAAGQTAAAAEADEIAGTATARLPRALDLGRAAVRALIGTTPS